MQSLETRIDMLATDGTVWAPLPSGVTDPMANLPARVILFLSSYAPLFAILAVRSRLQSPYVSIGFAAVAVGSVLVLALFVGQTQTLAGDKVIIASVVSRDGDAMSYIVTYLLPFLAVKLNQVDDVISLAIVFLVIGLLYVNSNMIYTNPILNIAGYHIFEVQDSGGKTTALICKRSYVRIGSELDVITLGDYVLMEKQYASRTSA